MSRIAWVAVVTWGLSALLWLVRMCDSSRGGAITALCATWTEPDEVLPNGSIRKGDVFELRR